MLCGVKIFGSKMFKFVGKIQTEPRFMYLKCDPELSRYYRYLAAPKIILIQQRIDSHVSIIRDCELPLTRILPPTYNDEIVEVFGNPEYIQNNAKHYWFRVISPRLEEIRTELGLPSQPAEILSSGEIITHPFHFTFGRIKGT